MPTRFLRGLDVDPVTRPYDAGAARAAAARVLATVPRDASRSQVMQSIQRALMTELGAWTAGWFWTREDGGPVRARRLALDDRETAVDEVCEALSEWRSFLEDLRARFADMPDDPERAAARLLPLVLERRHARALREYVAQVAATVRRDDAQSVEIADHLLAPLSARAYDDAVTQDDVTIVSGR